MHKATFGLRLRSIVIEGGWVMRVSLWFWSASSGHQLNSQSFILEWMIGTKASN